jgi:hypothetical protein
MAQVLGSLKSLALGSFCGLALVAACGPESRTNNNGNVDAPDNSVVDAPSGGPCVPSPEAAACGDMVDNDCDGIKDCADPDCSGVGACPVCGVVSRPNGNPLPLPDGTCESPGTNCTPQTSTINFTGFGANQTMTAVTDLQYVCAKMEHSWIRDLQLDLVAPDGKIVELSRYGGHNGGEVFLGEPNDTDDSNPVPGVGFRYCWTMDATRLPMLEFANANTSIKTLPATSYKPSTSFADLIGTKLNGAWQFRATDIWGADNGYVFEWTIAFNPALLTECPPPIE